MQDPAAYTPLTNAFSKKIENMLQRTRVLRPQLYQHPPHPARNTRHGRWHGLIVQASGLPEAPERR